MKEEAIVMTIDLGINQFSAVVLNNQLKLISSDGRMISISDPGSLDANEESKGTARLLDFLKH